MLTTGFWPTTTTTSPCILPQSASDAFTVFRKFYLAQYSGRQLTLQTHLVSWRTRRRRIDCQRCVSCFFASPTFPPLILLVFFFIFSFYSSHLQGSADLNAVFYPQSKVSLKYWYKQHTNGADWLFMLPSFSFPFSALFSLIFIHREMKVSLLGYRLLRSTFYRSQHTR